MTKSTGASHWDAVYEKPLSEIPWEIERPPKELVELLDFGRLKPEAMVLDVACGSGNYSVYLAKCGFHVTGVDFSEKALALAKKRAHAENVEVDFVHADVRHLSEVLLGKRFDFILDWSLLHHLAPEDFEAYAAQFASLLAPGGVLLLACFSEADAPKKGQTSAVGSLGNVMHYRSRKEIEAAYVKMGLKLEEYRSIRLGKREKHAGHYILFEI